MLITSYACKMRQRSRGMHTKTQENRTRTALAENIFTNPVIARKIKLRCSGGAVALT